LTSNRFYISQIDTQSPYVFLEGEEHHHLSRVSRIQPKEEIWLFDGSGRSYLARVEEVEKEKTKLFILEGKGREKVSTEIILAQSLVKSKNMEFIIQKSAELGIARFIPLMTSRSVVKIEEKIERKLERWERIALEAVKQSGNPWVPCISPPMGLKKLMKESKATLKLLLSENRGKYFREILTRTGKSFKESPPPSIMILIGPEGGWTKEEEEFILENGFEAVSLGKNILRTETAAICALALISHFWIL
jgi:16S rRNA (uracil1498-N3)-methyltransferase